MATGGTYFDGRSARPEAAEVALVGTEVHLTVGGQTRIYPQRDWKLDPVLGRTVRVLRFKDGSIFESSDASGMAVLDQARRSTRAGLWLHRLENHWRLVAASAIFTGLLIMVVVVWGLPYGAKVAAFQLSPRMLDTASEQTLSLLDREFDYSRLEPERRRELAELFASATPAYTDDYQLSVQFRHGGAFGANALALPNGTIIFTDELVELAETDEELVGVFLHEVGHVVHRHGMRSVLQGTAVGLLLTLAMGDVSAVTGAVSALPAVLIESRYSRDFEREADTYAAEKMREQGRSPEKLAALLERLSESSVELPAWLGSHPETAERVESLRNPETGNQDPD